MRPADARTLTRNQLAVCLVLVGLGLFGVVVYRAIDRIRVCGPIYTEIFTAKELASDILPPAGCLIESYLTVMQLVDARDEAERTDLEDKLDLLQRRYEAYQVEWNARVPRALARNAATSRSRQAAYELFGLVRQKLLPMLREGRREEAVDLVHAEMKEAYDQHRDALGELVVLTEAYSRDAELLAQSELGSIWKPTLLCMGGLLTTLIAVGIWRLGRDQERADALALKMSGELELTEGEACRARIEADRLAEIARRTSNAAVISDKEGRIEWVNEAFTRMTGYTLDEVRGKTPGSVLQGPKSHKDAARAMSDAVRLGQSSTVEIVNYAKDGREYLVNIEIMPRHDANGAINGFMAIETDVTEQRLAARRIAESESRFRSLADSAPLLLWTSGIDGRMDYFNKPWLDFTGATIEESLDEGWRSCVHPDDLQGRIALYERAFAARKPFEIEYRLRRHDGRYRLMHAKGLPRMSPDGGFLGYAGVCADITEQRDIEIESAHMSRLLMKSNFELEEAQSIARLGSWTYDFKSGSVTWSRQTYRLHGLDDSLPPPDYTQAFRFYSAEDSRRLDRAVRRAALDGQAYDLVLATAHGLNDVRFIRARGQARRDDSGEIIGLFGTVIDVTAEVEREQALKVARQQADASNRSKSEFLANMSHEIRTPLTAILGYADLLHEDWDAAEGAQSRTQCIETIRSAGRHLLTIINDILDLSKIEADKMTIESIETPLIRVVAEVESLIRPRVSERGVRLSVEFATPMPDRVMGDPTRIRQILMNLVGNAAKFTTSGRIALSARVVDLGESRRIQLDVEDTGPGMTPEQADRLFAPFTQVDNSVTRQHGGTGLGLTISRRLARLMGGDVTLEWTQPGEGARFRLEIPLVPAPGASNVSRLESLQVEPKAASPSAVVPLSGRILLAEDGLVNQKLITTMLTRAGAEVEVAANGRVALDMIEGAEANGAPFHLLLTDIQMPEMDGYTLVRTLRGRGSTLPIVALTAHTMAEDHQRCLDAGCDDYAGKPIYKAALLETCRRWIGDPAALPDGVPVG